MVQVVHDPAHLFRSIHVGKKSKREQSTAERDAAELRWRDEVITQAAEEWAREAPLREVRRLAEAGRGSWLYVEIPFSPHYRPPADGLYWVIFRPDPELDVADEIDSFWSGVLGDDAELIDDPEATLLFVDRVREIYRERLAAARG
jgi:hypothetical protein